MMILFFKNTFIPFWLFNFFFCLLVRRNQLHEQRRYTTNDLFVFWSVSFVRSYGVNCLKAFFKIIQSILTSQQTFFLLFFQVIGFFKCFIFCDYIHGLSTADFKLYLRNILFRIKFNRKIIIIILKNRHSDNQPQFLFLHPRIYQGLYFASAHKGIH